MADYPAVAARMKTELSRWLTTTGLGSFHTYMYVGTTLEEAAENVAVRYVEYYTRLADTRACDSVKVWKTLDDWPEHDSDFRLSIRSGPATRRLILKIIIAVSGTRWTLRLQDWTEGAHIIVDESGSVLASTDRVQFVPNRPRSPPRRPQFRDRDRVPV